MSKINQERAGSAAPTWILEELEGDADCCSVTELTYDRDGLDRVAKFLLEAKATEDELVEPDRLVG